MAGFSNDVVYGSNVDFSGGSPVSAKMLLDGQLLIGRTVANAGGTHIDVATLTSGAGISITNAAGSITVTATGATTSLYTEDVGTATPNGAGNLNILGTAAQGLSTSGAGNTVTLTNADWTTIQKGVGVLATNAETIAGSSTSKVVTPDDLKAKLGVQTNHSIALGSGTTTALNWLGVATNGQLPIGSTGADPVLAVITAGPGITVTNGAGSITIEATGVTSSQFTADAGTAAPALGNINVLGTAAQGISTAAAGSTITLTNADWTTIQKGVGFLATNAETITGASTTKVTTPDDVNAKLGTQTLHGLAIGAGSTNAITWTAEPTNGQILMGSTGNPPALGTITAGTGINVTNAAGSITVAAIAAVPTSVVTDAGTATPALNILDIKGKPGTPISTESPGAGSGKTVQIDLATVGPGFGGTGVVNPTAHTLPVAEGVSNFTFLGPLTNGQLLIGSTGLDPVPATLTAGIGISVTNAAGSITIASTGAAGGYIGGARAISTTATSITTVCNAVTAMTTGNSDLLLTVSYTATNVNSILEFTVSVPISGGTISFNLGLFDGSTFLIGSPCICGNNSVNGSTASFTWYKTASSTSAKTYNLRGSVPASTANILQTSGNNFFGASGRSAMIIMVKEYSS